MKVVVTGSGGQLGHELARTAPGGVVLRLLDLAECDIGDERAVEAMLAAERPDVVINAAAYTAVDRAESDAAAAARANVQGPRNLARGGMHRLLHVSTDFVFDGMRGRAYRTDDEPAPLSVYGSTKRDGERPVLDRGARGLVLRTSWVYSRHGNNFVKTMLRLMGSRPEVRVVADQVAAPTWAHGLAEVLWQAAADPAIHGLHHWRDAGIASWYDFAVAIAEEGVAAGLLRQMPGVVPIATSDYPTPARRPGFSLLDCTGTWAALRRTPPHWRTNLRRMLAELKESHG